MPRHIWDHLEASRTQNNVKQIACEHDLSHEKVEIAIYLILVGFTSFYLVLKAKASKLQEIHFKMACEVF